MFCRECETLLTGDLDSWGAQFLARFEADPYSPHFYDERFLRWAVSLSLRALLGKGLAHAEAISAASEAIGQYRGYLLGQRPSVGSFTQHVFLRYFEGASHFQKLLDWDFLPEQGLTFFKMGPLVVFGLMRRARWPRQEKRAADASIIRREGGYVQRTDEYLAGINIPTIMKNVLDEKNIRLLEGLESSVRRAQDYTDHVPEKTRLEIRERINAHRARHVRV